MAKDEDWDDLLGEAKSAGITPEMARTLLSMNPKLREEGKDTRWVIANNQKASAQAPIAAAAPPKVEGDALSLLDDLQRRYEGDEKQAQLQIKQIEAQRVQAKAATLDTVMKMLLSKDPELLSPITQQALADKKTFLDKLGFNVKAFVEYKRKSGKR